MSTLTMSLTSSMLLAGTLTGLIHIYDVASHQLLRTLSTHKGMSITYLSTMLRPPDLVGHINLSLSAGSAIENKESIPVRPVVPFQRIRDAKTREAHDVSLVLPQTEVRFLSRPNFSNLTYSGRRRQARSSHTQRQSSSRTTHSSWNHQ